MKFITLLLIVPTLMASTATFATEARLGFTGQVTNASCAVLPMTGLAQGKEVKVTGHKSIVVDTVHNACTGQAIPFTAHYQPVISADSGQANTAILTLTYQ